MWKKILRRTGAVLLVVLALLGGALAYAWFQVDARLTRTWDVAATPLTVGADDTRVARGAHLAATRGCVDCHGADLGGRVFIDDPMARIVASNLTAGQGGVLSAYSDAELARAIRHGLRRDGRSLLVMPTADYYPLGDEDVAALIAYLRQLSPVDRVSGASQLHLPARLLLAYAGAPWLSAETIDHAAPRAATPAAVASVDYGRYVASTCLTCHGGHFAGGLVNGPPGTPASANLTPAGRLRDWSEADFLTVMREGRTPEGRALRPEVMPWPAFAKMDETELRALWMFLRTLPPASAN